LSLEILPWFVRFPSHDLSSFVTGRVEINCARQESKTGSGRVKKKELKLYVTSGFIHGGNEILPLLGFYAA